MIFLLILWFGLVSAQVDLLGLVALILILNPSAELGDQLTGDF